MTPDARIVAAGQEWERAWPNYFEGERKTSTPQPLPPSKPRNKTSHRQRGGSPKSALIDAAVLMMLERAMFAQRKPLIEVALPQYSVTGIKGALERLIMLGRVRRHWTTSGKRKGFVYSLTAR